MDEILSHHGIKGMKWGVRRTPEQLGHRTGGKSSGGEKGKTIAKKTPSSIKRKTNTLSDEELQRRINRLNMEERYDDLVSRKKNREENGLIATGKKLLAESLESFAKQTMMGLATKAANKLLDNSKKFDINDYKDVDVTKMDADTIAKVSKWYGDALKINSSRSKLTPTNSDSGGDNNTNSGNRDRSDSGKSTNKQLDDWVRQRNRAMRDLNRR